MITLQTASAIHVIDEKNIQRLRFVCSNLISIEIFTQIVKLGINFPIIHGIVAGFN